MSLIKFAQCVYLSRRFVITHALSIKPLASDFVTCVPLCRLSDHIQHRKRVVDTSHFSCFLRARHVVGFDKNQVIDDILWKSNCLTNLA